MFSIETIHDERDVNPRLGILLVVVSFRGELTHMYFTKHFQLCWLLNNISGMIKAAQWCLKKEIYFINLLCRSISYSLSPRRVVLICPGNLYCVVCQVVSSCQWNIILRKIYAGTFTMKINKFLFHIYSFLLWQSLWFFKDVWLAVGNPQIEHMKGTMPCTSHRWVNFTPLLILVCLHWGGTGILPSHVSLHV